MEKQPFRKKKATIGNITNNMVTLFGESYSKKDKASEGRPIFRQNKFEKKSALGEYMEQFSTDSKSRMGTPDRTNPIYIPQELGKDITNSQSPLGILSYQGTLEDMSPSVPLSTIMKQVEKISKPLSKLEEKKLKKVKHLRVGSNLFYNEKP